MVHALLDLLRRRLLRNVLVADRGGHQLGKKLGAQAMDGMPNSASVEAIE